jgi:hypothetical protein
MSREMDLLDALEDAQEEYDRCRRQLKAGIWLVILGVASFIGTVTCLSILHMTGVNLGPVGLVNILFVLMAGAGAVITGGTWFEDLPPRRRVLRQAQRAHRNEVMK